MRRVLARGGGGGEGAMNLIRETVKLYVAPLAVLVRYIIQASKEPRE